MSFENRRQKLIWCCDVCGRRRQSGTTGNWDIDRAHWTEATEAGWSFDKLPSGNYIALCPEHAPVSDY
jgi:hypothetical protein